MMQRLSFLMLCASLCACSVVVGKKLDEKEGTLNNGSDASVADASLSDASRVADAGVVDGEMPTCEDHDEDGYGVGNMAGACNGQPEDCDDTNAAIHPGAAERCDNIDSDCDDMPDADETVDTWPDMDEDGFGIGVAGAATRMTCAAAATAHRADNNLDCLDVGDDAYCVNPLFGTINGLCSASDADYASEPYVLPSSELSWDYNCNGVVDKQHKENVSCLAPANDGMCTVPNTHACSGETGVPGTAACGESTMAVDCTSDSFCKMDATGDGECRSSYYLSRMGCR